MPVASDGAGADQLSLEVPPLELLDPPLLLLELELLELVDPPLLLLELELLEPPLLLELPELLELPPPLLLPPLFGALLPESLEHATRPSSARTAGETR